MRSKSPETGQKIIEFINHFYERNGFAPSMREIARAIGVNPSTVSRYVKVLKENDQISFGGCGRSLTPCGWKSIVNMAAKDRNTKRVKLQIEDGGILYLDCAIQNNGEHDPNISFSGIMDASELKSDIGMVIGCTTTEAE